MTDLPEGWDEYDPDNHDRSGDPEYARARAAAAVRAERRRAAYGAALASVRRARSLTQVTLAEQLGVAEGEISRIEHQADLLLSTIARYVEGVGGELSLLVRFHDQEDVVLTPSEVLEEALTSDAPMAEPSPMLSEVRRYDVKEASFRAVAAA